MVAMIDCFEVDLPGELAEIITFPGSWEPDPEPPAACGLCGDDGADRLPRVGGCGLALRLVAGMVAGEAELAPDHLTACPDCRAFFDRVRDLARVADMEANTVTPHAELCTVAA